MVSSILSQVDIMVRCIDILRDFPRDSNTHTHTYKIICNGKIIVDDGWKYVQKIASRETNEQIEYKQENTSSLSPGVSPWSGYSVLYRLIYYYHVSIINKWIWDYASWVRRRPHVIPCHTAPCLCDTEQVRCGRRLALPLLRFSLFWSFLFPFILRFVFKGLSFILLR